MLEPTAVREAWLHAREDASTLDAVLASQAGTSSNAALVELGRTFHYAICRLEEGGDIAPFLGNYKSGGLVCVYSLFVSSSC